MIDIIKYLTFVEYNPIHQIWPEWLMSFLNFVDLSLIFIHIIVSLVTYVIDNINPIIHINDKCNPLVTTVKENTISLNFEN